MIQSRRATQESFAKLQKKMKGCNKVIKKIDCHHDNQSCVNLKI